jgi:hypothetical protein
MGEITIRSSVVTAEVQDIQIYRLIPEINKA